MNKGLRNATFVTVAIAAVALAGVATWEHLHAPHAHAHAHDHDEPVTLTLNAGERWQTDAALRTGMQRIRDAVSQISHTDLHAQAPRLSAAIHNEVTFLVENCKLEPQADAVLHGFISDLIGGAEALKNGNDEGLARIAGALQRYPEYFDHPDWQPL